MTRMQLKDSVVTLICRLLAALFSARQRLGRRGAPVSPASILVLKPCCLGDVLMTTPVLSALRRGYPQAHITYAAGSWSRRVLEGNPNVDDLVDCGAVGSGPYRLADYWRLARELRRRRFDLAIVLDRSPALGLLPALAGVPYRVGLDSGGRGFAHTRRVVVDWAHPKHEAELYLDCVRALELPTTNPRLEFFPSAADRHWATEALAQYPQSPETGAQTPGGQAPMVAIHPGGAANPGMTLLAKRWQPERFAAIADRLADVYGAHIILVGAPSDAEAADNVQRAMRRQPLVLVGKTTLGQLAAVYECCLLMLGNDSGVMHLAVAMGIPVVAIFGPSDPRVYGPYSASSIAVRKDAQCAGRCFVPGRAIALHCDRRCIEAVTVEDVWEAVEKVLANRETAP